MSLFLEMEKGCVVLLIDPSLEAFKDEEGGCGSL